MYTRTERIKVPCRTYEIVSKCCSLLNPYMVHIGNKRRLHNLRRNLIERQRSSRIDFSENFQCKYGSEIQTVHFGGNRHQVTLHTGVLYSGLKPQCFCTISPDLQHDPIAIFMHLKPILKNHETIKKSTLSIEILLQYQ